MKNTNESPFNGTGNHGLQRRPMKTDEKRSAGYRWLNKPVLESRLLDDMENGNTWHHHGAGEICFTRDRSVDGTQSLRLTSKTKIDKNIDPDNRETYGRPFAEAVCRRSFNREDWSGFNRLSFWVYPSLPGFRVISMVARLFNDGAVKIPDSYEREGLNYFLLKPDQWNQVVWEIASLPRDRVTAVEIAYRLQGNEPGAADTVCFDIDRLELQKVQEDHYEGWHVAPGKISFSHTGYQAGSGKTAITGGVDADSFTLINCDTAEVVLSKPVQVLKTHIGEFQLLDFSEVEDEGNYILRAGKAETQPFRIDRNVWRATIWKTINFFFCERCGFEVPGIHGVCHRDWQCAGGDKRIVINGGWHDAGDLSQGVTNTSEAAYAMFLLAEKIRDEDRELYECLIEEAKWGLDWILKTRFGDGQRSVWATMDFWTDGIIGTFDDVTFKAFNSAFDNFVTSATEAVAARVLKDLDPVLSSYCLNAAREDWEFAVEKLRNSDYFGAFKRFVPPVQMHAECAIASIELYKATGDNKYSEMAFEQARVISGCQQKELTGWEIPLAGFFYTSPEKGDLLHYPHRSHAQAPLVALSELCREFPDHPEWMEWYSVIFLYSEYMKKIIEYTKPYGMTPCSVYRVDESDQPDYRKQVLNGVRLSDEYYLRLFPVWFAFRGNSSIILSNAKALSSAAITRRDPQLMDLCQLQLQWAVGRNPFAQSLMYGEGYDYAPQYTAMSGDMAGSLPVGVQTSGNRDVPYWPSNNCYNYKEVWVQPSARWLWLMPDLAGPAKVSGKIRRDVETDIKFTNNCTGKSTEIKADVCSRKFEVILPEGQYTVRHNGVEKAVVLLSAQSHVLDLDRFFCISVESETLDDLNVRIRLMIKSDYTIHIDIRSKNIIPDKYGFDVQSTGMKPYTIELDGRIEKKNVQWIAVIVPNGNHHERVEICG